MFSTENYVLAYYIQLKKKVKVYWKLTKSWVWFLAVFYFYQKLFDFWRNVYIGAEYVDQGHGEF